MLPIRPAINLETIEERRLVGGALCVAIDAKLRQSTQAADNLARTTEAHTGRCARSWRLRIGLRRTRTDATERTDRATSARCLLMAQSGHADCVWHCEELGNVN
jgi:hypothetical protein